MAEPRDKPRRPVIHQSGELLGGRRLGDARLRVTRREAQNIPVPVPIIRRPAWHPALVFIYGFAGLIIVGTIALALPFATASGQQAPLLTALFTATSAVCVTGLVVVDTGTYWSGFGHIIILVLIQLGGFGFMTSSTLLFLVIRRQISLRARILTSEAVGSRSLETAITIVRHAFYFTVVAEVLGAVVLTLAFWSYMDPILALWWAAFHSVSAFNNAGFDITGGFQSLVGFNNQPLVMLAISGLLILGGISFTVVADLGQRRFKRLTLDTKLVVVSSGCLLITGTIGLLFTERANDPSLGEMTFGQQLLNAFFMSASARTAGFNTIDMVGITDGGLLVLVALMFIGGASGSTAGGIKVQTFSLLLFVIISAVRGSTEVEAFNRRLPQTNVLRAIAVALLSLALVFAVTFVLIATEEFVLLRVLFEAFSAFGTVGLSTGVTPMLTALGQVIVIATMFIGRLGPLTLVLALAARERRSSYRWVEEHIRIG